MAARYRRGLLAAGAALLFALYCLWRYFHGPVIRTGESFILGPLIGTWYVACSLYLVCSFTRALAFPGKDFSRTVKLVGFGGLFIYVAWLAVWHPATGDGASPISSLCLFLLQVATAMRREAHYSAREARRAWLIVVTASLCFCIVSVGVIVGVSYLEGNPVMAHSAYKPMSVPSVLVFLLLSASILLGMPPISRKDDSP